MTTMAILLFGECKHNSIMLLKELAENLSALLLFFTGEGSGEKMGNFAFNAYMGGVFGIFLR